MRAWWPACAVACSVVFSPADAAPPQKPPAVRRPAARSAAVLPASYFSADATSAARLTEGLRGELKAAGWEIVSPPQSTAAARAAGIQSRRNETDRKVLEFGRRTGADLVVYPRLLVLGIGVEGRSEALPDPAAVVHLRILDVRTGRVVHSRQVAHPLKEFVPTTAQPARALALTPAMGAAIARAALAKFPLQPGHKP